MRLSALEGSPHFIGLSNFGRYDVLLDGEIAQDVVECDDAEGWVIRHARNENGSLMIEGGEIKKMKTFGAVTIIDKRPRR